MKEFSGFFSFDQGSWGYCDKDRLAVFSETPLTLTRLTILRMKRSPHPKVCQGFQVFLHLKDDVTATTSVSPIRAPKRYILFPSKRNRTSPTVTGRDFDDGLVNEAFQLTRLFRNGDDGDGFLAAALEETHHSGHKGKKCVVSA